MVDTNRMRRVLERVRPGPGMAPPPPGPAPVLGPGAPPPPEAEPLRQEEELTALCRALAGRSRAMRGALMNVIRASQRRRRALERERFFRSGDRPTPPAGPPPGRREDALELLRRAWRLSAELEKEYTRRAQTAGDRTGRQLYSALARSAGESRQTLRRLLERATR